MVVLGLTALMVWVARARIINVKSRYSYCVFRLLVTGDFAGT